MDVELQDDGTYLIDNNGDGTWDYIYDSETNELKEYSASTIEETKLQEDNIPIIILGLIVVIIGIVSLIIKKK